MAARTGRLLAGVCAVVAPWGRRRGVGVYTIDDDDALESCCDAMRCALALVLDGGRKGSKEGEVWKKRIENGLPQAYTNRDHRIGVGEKITSNDKRPHAMTGVRQLDR